VRRWRLVSELTPRTYSPALRREEAHDYLLAHFRDDRRRPPSVSGATARHFGARGRSSVPGGTEAPRGSRTVGSGARRGDVGRAEKLIAALPLKLHVGAMLRSHRACGLSLGVLVMFAQGCLLQQDQRLPLELAEGEISAKTIGAAGGVISHPPDFSLDVPAGALFSSTSLTVAPQVSRPLPPQAGTVLPGTAYDISPAGLRLASPARVEIRVPKILLELGDAVRLGIVLLKPDGSIVTSMIAYDATSGFLSAPLEQLGPVAAVIELDVIDIEAGRPPTLGGGNFSGVPSPVGSSASKAAANTRYGSSCSPDGRRCFSSGLVRVWISESLRDRLGGSLVIVAMTVFTGFDFVSFDGAGQPTSARGEVTVEGTLKARLGQTVTSYGFAEHRVTGFGGGATVTGVAITGNQMVFESISEGSNTLEFGLTRIATGDLLTLRIEEEIELENDDGSKTTGFVIMHVRLHR